jgi:Spy/CpxP family protein refolding chaperone
MRLKNFVLSTLLSLLISTSIWGQQPPQNDPISETLFPPELILQHQTEIGISESQKNFIREEVKKVQKQFLDLQFQIQDETEKLVSLLKQERTDENQVLAQLDKLLNIEREIKRTHFILVVRIKNMLTPEQKALLQKIKDKNKNN